MFSKQISIQITREQFMLFLSQNGIKLPLDVNILHGTQQDNLFGIGFPITIQWEEKIVLSELPSFSVAKVADLMSGKGRAQNRIEAIREIRTDTGWTLKDSKEWLDKNYPVTRTE